MICGISRMAMEFQGETHPPGIRFGLWKIWRSWRKAILTGQPARGREAPAGKEQKAGNSTMWESNVRPNANNANNSTLGISSDPGKKSSLI